MGLDYLGDYDFKCEKCKCKKFYYDSVGYLKCEKCETKYRIDCNMNDGIEPPCIQVYA